MLEDVGGQGEVSKGKVGRVVQAEGTVCAKAQRSESAGRVQPRFSTVGCPMGV